jgi:hypothetical protein
MQAKQKVTPPDMDGVTLGTEGNNHNAKEKN